MIASLAPPTSENVVEGHDYRSDAIRQLFPRCSGTAYPCAYREFPYSAIFICQLWCRSTAYGSVISGARPLLAATRLGSRSCQPRIALSRIVQRLAAPESPCEPPLFSLVSPGSCRMLVAITNPVESNQMCPVKCARSWRLGE